jgi:hypothetical protein
MATVFTSCVHFHFSAAGVVVARPNSGPVASPEPVPAFAGCSLQRVQEVGDASHVRRGLPLCLRRLWGFLRRSGVLVLLGLTGIGVPQPDSDRLADVSLSSNVSRRGPSRRAPRRWRRGDSD